MRFKGAFVAGQRAHHHFTNPGRPRLAWPSVFLSADSPPVAQPHSQRSSPQTINSLTLLGSSAGIMMELSVAESIGPDSWMALSKEGRFGRDGKQKDADVLVQFEWERFAVGQLACHRFN